MTQTSETFRIIPGELEFIEGVRCEAKRSFATGGNADLYEGVMELTENNKTTLVSVAIKVFRGMHNAPAKDQEKFLRRLKREEKNLKEARHPNVARFFGVSAPGVIESSPSPGLVALYYPNQNVMKYLEDNPKKALMKDRLRLIQDVANGLTHLHGIQRPTDRARVMVHGDVKPANVLVDHVGTAILCDFGQSRIIDETGYTTTFNCTVRYSAPETLFDENASSKATSTEGDVYSFGMTVLEISSGVEPFHHVTNTRALPALLGKGKRPERTAHPNTPDSLWRIIVSCWAEEKECRPTMIEVKKVLSNVKELA